MRLHLIYPGNKAYIQGKARYPFHPSDAGYFIALGLVVALFSLLALLSGLSKFPWQLILVILAPVNAEARVVDRLATTDSGGRTVYYIVYEYVVNDQRLTNRQSVSQDIYARAKQGTRLQIEYSRIAPNAARIPSAVNLLDMFFFQIAIPLFLTLVGLGILALALYGEANWRRRIRRAKLIEGQVLQAWTGEGKDSDGARYTATVLRVRFQTPQGRIIEGRKSYNTYDQRLRKRLIDHPPSTENTVAILYVDDKNWELL